MIKPLCYWYCSENIASGFNVYFVEISTDLCGISLASMVDFKKTMEVNLQLVVTTLNLNQMVLLTSLFVPKP